MHVSLRQAHKIVGKIHTKLAEIDISPMRSVNMWDNVDGAVEKMRTAYAIAVDRQQRLMQARQAIRDQIQAANRGEVDALVAARKTTLDQIGMMRAQLAGVSQNGVTSQVALDGKIDAARLAKRAGGASTSYYDEVISVCLLSQQDIDAINADISKAQLKVERIEDLLTSANAKLSTVMISDGDEEILRSEGLVG